MFFLKILCVCAFDTLFRNDLRGIEMLQRKQGEFPVFLSALLPGC